MFQILCQCLPLTKFATLCVVWTLFNLFHKWEALAGCHLDGDYFPPPSSYGRYIRSNQPLLLTVNTVRGRPEDGNTGTEIIVYTVEPL